MDRNIKRAGLTSQISDGEFVQALYLIELIADTLQKSLYFFHEDQWRDDFREFQFVVDGKLPTKAAAGEKYLNDSVVPTLGSRPDRSFGVPETWKEEPLHPFVERFSLERGRIAGRQIVGAIDLSGIFEYGLRFEDSTEHSGLQLADVVAYIVRSGVLDPDNGVTQRAYDAIRHKLRNETGNCLTLHRLRGTGEDRSSLDRYRPLYGLARTA